MNTFFSPDNNLQGDEKVDLNGALLGGREYSVKASILPRHPTKLYMSTMDVSRSLGFRDSYLNRTADLNIKHTLVIYSTLKIPAFKEFMRWILTKNGYSRITGFINK